VKLFYKVRSMTSGPGDHSPGLRVLGTSVLTGYRAVADLIADDGLEVAQSVGNEGFAAVRWQDDKKS
jgi:hypothetical protein